MAYAIYQTSDQAAAALAELGGKLREIDDKITRLCAARAGLERDYDTAWIALYRLSGVVRGETPPAPSLPRRRRRSPRRCPVTR